MASPEPKQYGLILPSKVKIAPSPATRKLNPLVDSDDELEKDEESPLNWVEASLKKSAGNSGQQSLQKRLLREALEEDASIFQYDEVYDDMKSAKANETAAHKNKADQKPKYIHNILKQAEKRKLEGERRMERKVQQEREAEGEEFADKESFVTASYLKKMEELKQAEREAKLEEMMEEKVDVVKHKNFSVFYNHLFQQRVGAIKEEPKSGDENGTEGEKLSENKDGSVEEAEKKKDEAKRPKNYRTQRDLSESPERQTSEPKGKKRKAEETRHLSRSSDSEKEDGGIGETYRDRREKYKAMEEKKKEDVKGKDDERSKDRKRDKSKERQHRSKDRGRDRSRDRGRNRSRDRDRDKSRDRGRDRSRDRGRDRSRDRGRDRSRDRSRDRGRDRSRDRGRDRSHDRGRDRSRNRGRERSRERRVRSRDREKVRVRESERERDRGRERERERSEERRKDQDEQEKIGNRERSRRSKSKEAKHRYSRSRSHEEIKIKEEPKSPDVNSSPRDTKDSMIESEKKDEVTVKDKAKEKIKEEETNIGNATIKKESDKDEKEQRLERIQKIFTKRTVGEKFEQALQRYYIRKAASDAQG